MIKGASCPALTGVTKRVSEGDVNEAKSVPRPHSPEKSCNQLSDRCVGALNLTVYSTPFSRHIFDLS